MARKRTESDDVPKPPAKLKIPLADAETQIEQQIEEGEQLFQRAVNTRREELSQEDALEQFRNEVQIWDSYTAELLCSIFTNSKFCDEFNYCGPMVVNMYAQLPERWEEDKASLRQQITRLRSIKKRLPLLEVELKASANASATKTETPTRNRAIFLVHGHHEESKQSVARLIEKLHLEAIILDEQTNVGKTIIENFERHSDVAFAVVLLTPDDVGRSKVGSDKLKPRARQNVVLELGCFIGKLGRERVAILYVKGVELPSDLKGLLYIEYEKSGAWKLRLAKEMKAAGLRVDLNEV